MSVAECTTERNRIEIPNSVGVVETHPRGDAGGVVIPALLQMSGIHATQPRLPIAANDGFGGVSTPS